MKILQQKDYLKLKIHLTKSPPIETIFNLNIYNSLRMSRLSIKALQYTSSQIQFQNTIYHHHHHHQHQVCTYEMKRVIKIAIFSLNNLISENKMNPFCKLKINHKQNLIKLNFKLYTDR